MRALVLISVVGLLGCANPDDIFPINGTVDSKAGVEGISVQVFRQTQGEGQYEFCHFDGLAPFLETTTDARGAYAFDVFRAQAQSLTNFISYCFQVRVRFASGAESWVDLRDVNDRVTVPALIDWVPNMRLENEVLRFEPAIDDLSADLQRERFVMHRSSFRIAGDEVKWNAYDLLVADAGENAPFDIEAARVDMKYPPEVFANFAGTLRLEALVVYNGASDGGGSLLSPSRYDTVSVTPGQSLEVHGERVPLTDGLTRQLVTGVQERPAVRYTFPTPTTVSTLVLRDTSLFGAVVVIAERDGGVAAPMVFPVQASVWEMRSPSIPKFDDTGMTVFSEPGSFGLWRFDAGQPVDAVIVQSVGLPPEDGGVSFF